MKELNLGPVLNDVFQDLPIRAAWILDQDGESCVSFAARQDADRELTQAELYEPSQKWLKALLAAHVGGMRQISPRLSLGGLEQGIVEFIEGVLVFRALGGNQSMVALFPPGMNLGIVRVRLNEFVARIEQNQVATQGGESK
ncbi:MAG: hypothetical protein KTR25_18620 [Myxococcales bacterium]|nr:hypothetical protein [Myxococcales bacterium]